jgi:hypothetical protein
MTGRAFRSGQRREDQLLEVAPTVAAFVLKDRHDEDYFGLLS